MADFPPGAAAERAERERRREARGKGPASPSRGQLVVALVAFLAVLAGLWAWIWWEGLEPQLGLDLRGGVSLVLVPAPGQEVDDEVLDQTVDVLRDRVDRLGVAEPDIRRQGENVLVDLPGAADREEAQDVVGRTARLQFRPVRDLVGPSREDYDEVGDGCEEIRDRLLVEPPDDDEELVLCQREVDPTTGEELPVDQWTKVVVGPTEISGERIDDARAALDEAGVNWQVALDLDGEGGRRFAEITGEMACEAPGAPERRFAIVLDGVVESAPEVNPGVECNVGIGGGRAVITTDGSEESTRELALVLQAGALPITLDVEQSQNVTPTLGQASLDAGLTAGLLGLALVALYLVLLYRGIGLASVVELVVFGGVVAGLLVVLGEYIGFTLTLAGVAGIIVAIGIAADSSIIYRERYRDEIRKGRTVRSAADHAFASAWRTNLTGNTVSFLAAVVLWLLAIGPVRGFAFTLGLATLVDTLLFGTFTRSMFGLLARSPRLARSSLMGLRADVASAGPIAALRRRGSTGG